MLVQPLDDEIRPQVPVSPFPVSLRWNRVVVTGADVGFWLCCDIELVSLIYY
ncbi:hypothetical protein ACVXHB_17135 [Escherichia coli]